MKKSAFYCLHSNLSGSLTLDRSFRPGWTFKHCATRQTATKFGYVLILLLAFLFKREQCPSKFIAFCNQSTKSTTSNFYAEFRNSLPLLVQLLSRSSKATNFHSCPLLVSRHSLPYLSNALLLPD
jgi:hypothetical protein